MLLHLLSCLKPMPECQLTEQNSKLQKYAAPALEKGLDILEYLSLTDTRPTLSQIAAGIGRSKSEIFRMMIVLEERGYIHRSENDHYRLTDRLAVLGTERSANARLAEASAPYLNILAEQTGLSNHLSVLDNGTLLVIANTAASQSYGLTVQVGYRAQVAGTSSGACFLTDLATDDARQQALANLGQPTDRSTLNRVEELASDCRTNGHVLAANPETNSIFELSTPVRPTSQNQTVAAITIPYFASDEMKNRLPTIVDSATTIAAAISEMLTITMPSTGKNELLTS